MSLEKRVEYDDIEKRRDEDLTCNKPGYLQTILRAHLKNGISYQKKQYKYLVVLMGLDGMAR